MTGDGGTHEALVRELRALGAGVANKPSVPVPAIADAVLARLPASPPPRPRSSLLRRRLVTLVAAVVALLAGLLAAPPVRAAVADWFGFGGVQVRIAPTPGRTTAPPPPAALGTASLADAEAALGFAPLVPAELGPPDAVEVSADRRSVSMSWSAGPDGMLRLDQWAAGLDGLAAKTAPGVTFTTVGQDFAIWFDSPHEVVLTTHDHGGTRTERPRLAGHTLIWQSGGATLRLEGDLTRERAVQIAASARPAR
jgi:hypothetical protein